MAMNNYKLLSLLVCVLWIVFLGVTLMVVMCSCTVSINLGNSNGKASDLIDTDQQADADVKADIPISGV